MTLILEEPFKNLSKWTALIGSPHIGDGRTGMGLPLTAGQQISFRFPVANESIVMTMGTAFKTTSLAAGTNAPILFRSDLGATNHAALRWSPTGTLEVVRGSTVLASSAAGLVQPNVWYYVECQITLGDAPDGAVIVRLNNVVVINATGIDTRGGGTKVGFDTLMLIGGPSVGATTTFDDMYVKSGPGETFMGDHRYPEVFKPRLYLYTMGAYAYDISCDVRSMTIDRGRSTYTDAFSAASATIEMANFEGRYSAWDPDGMWSKEGLYHVDVPIQIEVDWNVPGIVEVLYVGSTDSVVDSWPGTTDAKVTVTATDGFKKLARHNGGPRAVVGAGELSGARINRLLTDAGWPTGAKRRVDAGQVHMQGTTMEGVTLDLMREVGEAEWGWLFVDRDGALVFRQRDAFQTDPRMLNVQWTFTDTEAYNGVCYSDLQLAADDSRIINQAQITPPGIATQTATDAPSIAWFGPRTYTSALPISVAADALGTAQVIVLEYASDEKRVESITFDALHSMANTDAAVSIRVNDRIRVLRSFPGSTFAIDIELLVMGVHHEITAGGKGRQEPSTWMVTVSTANAVFTAKFGHWDDPVGPAGAETQGWDVSQWGI